MRLIGIALVVILLCACSTPNKSKKNYYSFEFQPNEIQNDSFTSNSRVLKVNQIKVVGVSDQQGIVQLLGKNKVSIAQNHFWAENPSYMLGKTLQQALQNKLTHWQVTSTKVPSSNSSALLLSVEVSDFAGHDEAGAVISGRWYIYEQTSQGNKLLTHHMFTLSTALSSNGFSALVNALQTSWLNLANQIATELTLLTKSPADTN
ncbi:Intermembrane transport lipoprotein PqiC [Pseudoalteromonas holothuriae]|uniref:Intermembrane transport lipoprotein PqiC n=1 Tax=Pseudoalteromonas holothuriae TaxID=2963714 RepID=A0A9W4VXC0_9GAMM|nr:MULTISPECIES: PqiC family protein [unclassified Pseudoalteromonas]CAH9050811.1 Intermembrane transport lipoprotein PqiC [Pseudoalteromonas sp. CIP111951]CAH9061472.1 Intermembrane transport lipoprotein PqiC [Pseudoalteromonas sp. CIP111854]